MDVSEYAVPQGESRMRTLVMGVDSSDKDAAIRDQHGRTVGMALAMNPLALPVEEVARAIEQAPGELVLLGSGWMGEDRQTRDVRNWGPQAWAALETLVDHLDSALEGEWTEKRILFRPAARAVLSDTQRCMKLFHERDRRRIGLALEPCAMLEAGMLEKVEDHLARSFGALGPMAGTVVLGNVSRAGDDDDAPLQPTAVESGDVPPLLLGAPAQERAWEGIPVIVITDDYAAAQRALAWPTAVP